MSIHWDNRFESEPVVARILDLVPTGEVRNGHQVAKFIITPDVTERDVHATLKYVEPNPEIIRGYIQRLGEVGMLRGVTVLVLQHNELINPNDATIERGMDQIVLEKGEADGKWEF